MTETYQQVAFFFETIYQQVAVWNLIKPRWMLIDANCLLVSAEINIEINVLLLLLLPCIAFMLLAQLPYHYLWILFVIYITSFIYCNSPWRSYCRSLMFWFIFYTSSQISMTMVFKFVFGTSQKRKTYTRTWSKLLKGFLVFYL